VLVYDWLVQSPSCLSCFAIDSSTGAVTLTSAGSTLDFNVARSYNLTVRVTYPAVGGLFDTAAVTVWVVEINKPSSFVGLYNASSGASMTSAVISEATLPGTAIARVLFADPNTAWPWNARIYCE
jgi:hypothetical protein